MPTPAVLEQVADAVVAVINTAVDDDVFTPHDFEAYRPFDFRKEVTQLAPGVIDTLVIPLREEETDVGRKLIQVDFTVEVGVRVKTANRSKETVDPYPLLVEKIRNLFRRAQLTTAAGLKVTNITRTIAAPWDAQSLDETSVFMSTINLVFRTIRTLA